MAVVVGFACMSHSRICLEALGRLELSVVFRRPLSNQGMTLLIGLGLCSWVSVFQFSTSMSPLINWSLLDSRSSVESSDFDLGLAFKASRQAMLRVLGCLCRGYIRNAVGVSTEIMPPQTKACELQCGKLPPAPVEETSLRHEL